MNTEPNRHEKCGSDRGYYHHIRKLREPACSDCRAAHAEAERRRVRGGSRRSPECGTPGGYDVHRRRGEATCEACRKAEAAARRERRAALKQRGRVAAEKPVEKPVIGWERKGLILVPVFAEDEVA